MVAYVCSALGISGITFNMLGATKRLEGKQAEAYAGQPNYDAWVASSNALLPKVL